MSVNIFSTFNVLMRSVEFSNNILQDLFSSSRAVIRACKRWFSSNTSSKAFRRRSAITSQYFSLGPAIINKLQNKVHANVNELLKLKLACSLTWRSEIFYNQFLVQGWINFCDRRFFWFVFAFRFRFIEHNFWFQSLGIDTEWVKKKKLK